MGWTSVSGQWITEKHDRYTLFYKEPDRSSIREYSRWMDAGIGTVEKFTGHSFPRHFELYIHPSRQSLDQQWQKDWKMPDFKSECWMVASGVASKLDLISPKIWDRESCEHSYADTIKTQQLITHELFHVYHGQLNGSPDFSETAGLDWFVEGFATYASGQCDSKRLAEVKNAIEADTVLLSLDNFWKGKLKYGQSGSIVKYIDQHYGRKKLMAALPFTKKEEVLKSLSVTENDLLAAWKAFLLSGAPEK